MAAPRHTSGGGRSSENKKDLDVSIQVPDFLARLEEETSNRLFETLEEWNDYLKRYVPAFKEPAP